MNEIPVGWAAATLDDLGEFLNGMAFKPEDWTSDGTPIIRIQNLTDPEKPLNRTRRIFDDRYAVRRGDLLISWSATLDAFIWDREDAVLNQHIFKVIASEASDRRFLFYLSKQCISDLLASDHLHGSTMKHINRGPFLAHGVALPPIAEQQRIVAKLDALTTRTARARADLDRIPALAVRYRQAVLKAFDAPTSRTELVSVANIATQIFDGPFGSHLKSDDYVDAGVRVVRLENIGHLDFIENKRTFISAAKYETLKRHALLEHDVMFSSFVDEQIRVCVLPALNEPTINKADCFCIRVDTRRVDPKFLAYRLARESTFEVFKDMVHGATRPRINLSQLKSFAFDLPSLDVQVETVKRIDHAFAEIDRLTSEAAGARKLLDRLDQAILAKAFRGELVPQDPADEPASILLDRIRSEHLSAPKAKRGRMSAA